MPIEGQTIDQGEVAAVKIALTKLADDKAGWYRHMISDTFLSEVAEAAVAASVAYRTAPTI